jgi:hypothetical protein
MLNAHRGTTNNYGHVAPFDFRPHSRPVIVLGDSYVESLMNDYADTLQGQLGRLLGAPEAVYGLGVSGASASGYVALGRLAHSEFAPTAAVIVITDGDLSESLLPETGGHSLVRRDGALQLRYDPIGPPGAGSRLRNAIGDIALHRYFQVNLQFAPEHVLRALTPQHPAAARSAAGRLQQQRDVADWFLRSLPDALGLEPACIALLLDADRYAMYRPRSASVPKDEPVARQYLIDEATRRGFKVKDLGPEFAQRHARDHVKFDHWPIDRHWNAQGHGLAAEMALQLLGGEAASGRALCLAARGAPAQ